MPRPCSVCTNPAREAVERDLLAGRTLTAIAAEYRCAPTSLRRHRDRHLGPRLRDALARADALDAEKLAAWLLGLNDRTLVALGKAEAAKDWNAVRGLVREARANLETIGRVAGIIDPTPSTYIDARRQTAVLANLSEDELRALARAAADGSEGEADAPAGVPTAFPALGSPLVERDLDASPTRQIGGQG